MPLLRDAFTALTKAAPAKIIPQTPYAGNTTMQQGILGTATDQQLRAMETNSWIFSSVDRIATSVAAVEWKLMKRGTTGDTEVMTHPILDFWRKPNPFYSRFEYNEASQQHMELAGVAWWTFDLDRRGLPPSEMWLVRPDRMTIVKNKEAFIVG